MLLIDDREGSVELSPYLPSALVVRLDFGDAMIIGNGPDGEVEVGVERKRIGDLVNSMTSGRLSGHQIPGMLSSYYRSYLIVEGSWKEDRGNGELIVKKGALWGTLNRGGRRFTAAAIWAYLTTLEQMTGVIVRQTRDIRDTAFALRELERWWTKPWERHTGHLQIHKQRGDRASMTVHAPSRERRMYAELPGIGWKRSMSVERAFPTVESLLLASEADLMQIEGIGKVTAGEIYKFLHRQV